MFTTYYKVPNNSRGGNNSWGGTNASILIIVGVGIIVVVGNLNFHNDLVRKVGVGKKVIEIKIKKSLMHFSLTSRHKFWLINNLFYILIH